MKKMTFLLIAICISMHAFSQPPHFIKKKELEKRYNSVILNGPNYKKVYTIVISEGIRQVDLDKFAKKHDLVVTDKKNGSYVNSGYDYVFYINSFSFVLNNDNQHYLDIKKKEEEAAEQARILAYNKAWKDAGERVNELRKQRKSTTFMTNAYDRVFDYDDITNMEFNYWKKLIDDRGGSSVPIYTTNDAVLGWCFTCPVNYKGSTITYESYEIGNERSRINVKIIFNGKGTFFPEGCSITGNWIDDELDMYSIANKDGLSGYWVNSCKINGKGFLQNCYECENWTYLGNDKSQIDANLEKEKSIAEERRKERNREFSKEFNQKYSIAKNAYLHVKSKTIVKSSVESEIHYKIVFDDGKEGEIVYNKNCSNNCWSLPYFIFSDNLNDENSALTKLWMELHH